MSEESRASYWKNKFEALQMKIHNLWEEEVEFERREIPDQCDSASDVFFISNLYDVVDNEEYAKKNWGEGKYFKVIKPFVYVPTKRKKRDGQDSRQPKSK